MFSLLVRRTHMYLALFFVPWMLMYSLAAVVGNHGDFFQEHYGGNMWEWETETDEVYTAEFPAEAGPPEIAEQILAHLSLEGTHTVNKRADDGQLLIRRLDPVMPRQITYTPADNTLVVKRQVFRVPVFLTQLHHRHGYQNDNAVNDLWAFAVDLAVFGMVFWVGSGLWMWWQLKATRRLGSVCLVVGVGLFGIFLFSI